MRDEPYLVHGSAKADTHTLSCFTWSRLAHVDASGQPLAIGKPSPEFAPELCTECNKKYSCALWKDRFSDQPRLRIYSAYIGRFSVLLTP